MTELLENVKGFERRRLRRRRGRQDCGITSTFSSETA